MISTQDREIQSLVNDIREGRLLLPELQRGYVWKSTQVRDFFDSLYHQYPTGQLLIWETEDLPFAQKPGVGGLDQEARRPHLLLDGQQRLTSLAAVMLGQPFIARDRDRERRIDIVFNVRDERFEVADAASQRRIGSVSLTKLFTKGGGLAFADLKLDLTTPEGQQALERLNRLDAIKSYKYRVNVLESLSYEEVTDIFVRINSGGTVLSNADLVLAQVSSRWRGVTEELDKYRAHVKGLGWELDNSILLRTLSAVLINQSRLSQFFSGDRKKSLTVEDLQGGWERAKPAMDQAIHFLRHNCSIDYLSMLPTDYVLVPLTLFFCRSDGNVTERDTRDLQRWLYMALIWSRYSGSSETRLDEDLSALNSDQPIQRMIQNIEDKVGRRPVTERELQGQLSNSPFMVMAYALARRAGAHDWFNGVAIGAGQIIEYHHIFPKARLASRYDLRRDSRIINQIANLAFLSDKANARIAAKDPAEYLAGIEESRLRAQYVPLDRSLWTLDRYEEFLLARRTLLASAINDLLQSLMDEPPVWLGNTQKLLEERVNALEQQARDLIEARLTANFGPAAWRERIPGDIKKNVTLRVEQRIKRNPFEKDDYETMAAKLAQCQFGDYLQIILFNWDTFVDVFGHKQRFEQHYGAVQEARNAFKHGRDMNPSEEKVSEGGLIWLEDCLRRAENAAADAETEDEMDDELAAPVA